MKNAMILFLSSLLITSNAFAEIWVTPSELTTRAKNETLMQRQREELSDSDLESFFDLQLSHPITANQLTEFLDAETEAQRAEVNGDFLDALEKYNHLIEKLFEVPNVSGVQKITFSALVHRAHLADILKLNTAEKLWGEARAFYPTVNMTKSEFAPDLVKRFNKLNTTSPFELILTANPNASVFIDGRNYKANEGELHTSLEFGPHQACALVPGSQWTCTKIDFAGPLNYLKVNLESQSVVSGSCDQPEFRGHPIPTHVKLVADFSSPHCQRVYYDKTWFTMSGQRLESLTPSQAAPLVPLMQSSQVSEPEKTNWFQDLTKSGWFWTGVGAVIVGALVISTQNQQPVVVPSQSYR